MDEQAEIITMDSNEKINPEMAEAEFKRWADVWDIDDDLDDMDLEAKEDFNGHKRRITKAIKKGRAFISDDGSTVTYNLIEPVAETSKIEMRIPKGDSWLLMDKYKEKQQFHKFNAFMSASSKVYPKIFSSMDGRDLKFFQSVTALFLAS